MSSDRDARYDKLVVDYLAFSTCIHAVAAIRSRLMSDVAVMMPSLIAHSGDAVAAPLHPAQCSMSRIFLALLRSCRGN
jgi:hypothetical protein